MSGSSCATTGSATGSSPLTTTSSSGVVTPGTASSSSPGRSCPSDCANARVGYDQCRLVSDRKIDGSKRGDCRNKDAGEELCAGIQYCACSELPDQGLRHRRRCLPEGVPDTAIERERLSKRRRAGIVDRVAVGH